MNDKSIKTRLREFALTGAPPFESEPAANAITDLRTILKRAVFEIADDLLAMKRYTRVRLRVELLETAYMSARYERDAEVVAMIDALLADTHIQVELICRGAL